jgi:hypothetical protein
MLGYQSGSHGYDAMQIVALLELAFSFGVFLALHSPLSL